MGQRLLITVRVSGKPVLNCYFHWSGYTMPAIHLAKGFIKEYAEERERCRARVRSGARRGMPNRKSSALAAALRAWPGSGIHEGDRKSVWELMEDLGFDASGIYGDPYGDNRNDGLIAISPAGMEANALWSEYELWIDLMHDGKAIVSRFDPLDLETISTYKDEFLEDPEYREVEEGVMRYYAEDLSAEDLDELEKLLDGAPGFAIGCLEEDRMLVQII